MSLTPDPPLSRRAAREAQLAAQEASQEGFAQPVTRRERGGVPVSVPSSAPSDVTYRTQVRPRVPHYDASPAPHTLIVSPGPAGTPAPGGAGLEPLVEPPVAPSASIGAERVRRRDFRPPAEHPAPERTAVEHPAPAPPTTQWSPVLPPAEHSSAGVANAPAGFDTPLQYHTQLSPRADAFRGAPVAETESDASPPVHVITPPVDGRGGATAAGVAEQTLSRRELRALREAAGLSAETSTDGAAVVATPAPSYPPTIAPAPITSAPVAPAPVIPAPMIPVSQPTPISSAPSPSVPSGSHWSDGIDDDDDPFDNTFSRQVGSTASLTNTNALVLPEMPLGSIAGPVAGTGEIIITGMIDLPLTVASTGTVPTVHESPDIDDLFDPADLAVAPPDSAPVSALRAVSSHSSAPAILSPGRPSRSNTVTTVLVASTVVMAVVAIGLFIVAAVNGLL